MIRRSIAIYLGFLLIIPYIGLTQETRIQLLDKVNNEPVAYANVVLSSLNNNTIVAGYVSDINGIVIADIPQKSIIKLSYIGYHDYVDTISPGGHKTIYLKSISYNVDEVVVTGQYAAATQDKSIYKVKVISAKEIERRAAVNIKEMLSTELNIRTSHDNALGSSISMQGLGGEHIKFLVDGVPVIGREAGNIDLDQLNLQNVDHVEIINGPMSVVYGSNALAGVVNIISKQSDRLLFASTVDAYYESVGVYNLNLSASGTVKQHSFSFTGGRNFFDGYSPVDTGRWQQWKPKEQWILNGDYKYKFKKGFAKLGGSYFNQELRDKGILLPPYYETAFDKFFYTNRFVGRIDSRYNFSYKSRFNLTASYSAYSKIKNTYFNDLTTLEKKLAPGQQDTTRFSDILLRADYSFGDENTKLKYQTGIDLNNEKGNGKRIKDNSQEIGDYAFFASLNYTPVMLLNIQTGLRLIYNTRFSAPVIYSLNVKYDISEHLSARASIASGFRAPSLKELYLDFVDINHDIHGNENLKAETSISTNIFLQYNSSSNKPYVWGLELNVFNNNIKDNIQLVPLTNNSVLYTYVNINRFITRGIELNFNNNVYPWLTVKFGFAVTGQKIDYSGLTSSEFEYYTGFNIAANYDVKKYDINLAVYYKYNGEYPQLYFNEAGGEPTIRTMMAYNTLDISIGKWFWKRRINFQAGGKNLFDNTNIDVTGGSQGGVHTGGNAVPVNWGRTFFLRLQFRFNK